MAINNSVLCWECALTRGSSKLPSVGSSPKPDMDPKPPDVQVLPQKKGRIKSDFQHHSQSSETEDHWQNEELPLICEAAALSSQKHWPSKVRALCMHPCMHSACAVAYVS